MDMAYVSLKGPKGRKITDYWVVQRIGPSASEFDFVAGFSIGPKENVQERKNFNVWVEVFFLNDFAVIKY